MSTDVPHVLIVGAGFAGFHCARELERLLGPGEARVTLASPTDYMLYSPLLPHVAAGILSPADVAVPLRRTLRRTLRVPCWIVGVDLDDKVCVARTILGQDHTVGWDRLVLCPGAVTRTFAIPGPARDQRPGRYREHGGPLRRRRPRLPNPPVDRRRHGQPTANHAPPGDRDVGHARSHRRRPGRMRGGTGG